MIAKANDEESDPKDTNKTQESRIPWKLLLGFASIVLTTYDIGSDIALVMSYFINGHVTYFALTLTFVILPAIIISISSCISRTVPLDESKMTTSIRWTSNFCYMGILGLLYELARYEYTCKKRKNDNQGSGENNRGEPDCKKKIEKRCRFIKLMGLLDALFESIPQVLLQVYIIIRNMQVIRLEFSTGYHPGIPKMDFSIASSDQILKDHDAILENAIQRAYFNVTEEELNRQLWKHQITTLGIIQVSSIFASLASIAWALTSYTRYNYDPTNRAQTMPLIDTCCHFLWRLFQISSRVFAFSLFSSAFTFWCYVPLLFRLVYIFAFMKWMKGIKFIKFRQNLCIVLLFPFTFFSLNKVKNSKYKNVTFGQASYIYFVYRIIEDTCLVALWCRVVDPKFTWFYYWSIGIHGVAIIFDFLFMFIYLNT